MSHHFPNHLKRLQHDVNLNLHLSSHNHHPQQLNNFRGNSFDHRSQLPNDEAIRESIQHFTISAVPRTFNPAPQRARRGGGGGGERSCDRHWHSSMSLPRRAINYDLAESFVDHSTNPLSSDLYKIKFKHSTKQWPNGRFINYKEKLDKSDGNIIPITCTRTFDVVHKKKNMQETNDQPNVCATAVTTSTPLLVLPDPVTQEEKKKQADKQTYFYANLFGGGRIPRKSSNTQVKKPDSTTNSTSSTSTAISLLGESSTEHPS